MYFAGSPEEKNANVIEDPNDCAKHVPGQPKRPIAAICEADIVKKYAVEVSLNVCCRMLWFDCTVVKPARCNCMPIATHQR
jgi:hypothetical protein